MSNFYSVLIFIITVLTFSRYRYGMIGIYYFFTYYGENIYLYLPLLICDILVD